MMQAQSTSGRQFGKFRPLAVLGRGGMANVYLAVSSGPGGFNKLVVVKELKPELADDPEFKTMFLEEARLAARLIHPNVVQTYEVIDAPDLNAFVMEYLDGQPMNRVRTRLQQMGRELALGAQLRIIAELLAGLHYAHELKDYDGTPLKIVHRDISPHNVFVSYDGSVKVVDFGIAKASDSSQQTKVGIIKGKLSYMAPEQALGQPIDRRADVFAVGIILWEAATGQRIWKGMQDAAILNLLSNGAIPSVDAVEPDVPRELVAICKRALAQNPEERYPTAADFLADLERVMRAMPSCPGTRELGALLTQSFEEERTKIRGVIEDQMRTAKAAPTGEYSAPLLAQLAPQMSGTPVSQSQVSNVASLQQFGQTGSQLTGGAQTMPAASPKSSPFRVAAIAGGSVIMLGAIVLFALTALKNHQGAGTAGSANTAAITTPTSPSSAVSIAAPIPPPTSARLTINVTPKTARTSLDGKSILTPGPTTLPVDGKQHLLKVEAPGFQTRSMELAIDGDKMLDVALDKNGVVPSHPTGPATSHSATHGNGTPGNGDPDLGF